MIKNCLYKVYLQQSLGITYFKKIGIFSYCSFLLGKLHAKITFVKIYLSIWEKIISLTITNTVFKTFVFKIIINKVVASSKGKLSLDSKIHIDLSFLLAGFIFDHGIDLQKHLYESTGILNEKGLAFFVVKTTASTSSKYQLEKNTINFKLS